MSVSAAGGRIRLELSSATSPPASRPRPGKETAPDGIFPEANAIPRISSPVRWPLAVSSRPEWPNTDARRGELGALVVSAVRHLFAPDVATGAVDFARRRAKRRLSLLSFTDVIILAMAACAPASVFSARRCSDQRGFA